MEKTRRLGRDDFYSQIFKLVLPIIIQNLLSAAVSSADVVMLNYVGQSSISAVSLAAQYASVLFMVFYGLGTGVTILCAQYYGKGDMRAIQVVEGIAMRFSIPIAAAFAAAALLVKMVVPELVSCIQLLGVKLSEVIGQYGDSRFLPALLPEETLKALASMDWEKTIQQATRFLSSGISGAVGTMTSMVASLFSGMVTCLVGFIFSVYLLSGKEKLQSQGLRLMRSYLRPEWNRKILYVLRVLNDSFHHYIVGQCVEAVILGSLCAGGMLILRMPYAVMIGTLVGFTALIPVAGAYIGAGVGAFMILTVSPLKAVLFLVFIVVLQQVEGNVIYPRVVGSSVGLPGIWVLAAVTIGGGLSGVLGMLLGVPIAASLYRMLREDVGRHDGKG